MDGYEITDDPARIDVEAAHAFLTTSYWSPGVPMGKALERRKA